MWDVAPIQASHASGPQHQLGLQQENSSSLVFFFLGGGDIGQIPGAPDLFVQGWGSQICVCSYCCCCWLVAVSWGKPQLDVLTKGCCAVFIETLGGINLLHKVSTWKRQV